MINFIVICVSVVGLFQSNERSMLIRRKQVILVCLKLCKHLKVSLFVCVYVCVCVCVCVCVLSLIHI